MKDLATILVILIPKILFGQFYHSDPYEYKGVWSYSMEFDKKGIIQNNINEVEVWSYVLKEDSATIKDSILDYKILFNEQGLPINFHSEYTMPVWWWPAFKRKIGLEKVRTDTFDSRFEYDSFNRLSHISEYYYEGYGDGTYDQNDIWNEYDIQGRLTYQLIEEKYIYPIDFKYRGRTYPNDTNRITASIEYDENLVKSVYRSSDDYNHFTYNKRKDTLDFNCTFDSVFMKQPVSQGTELDSLNRIIKTTRFLKRVNLLGGSCYYVETENDIIYTHYYDEQGQKSHIESHLRSGKYVSTQYFEYKGNLIQKIWSTNSLSYTKYKYKNYL
jgi:hypothetical protein